MPNTRKWRSKKDYIEYKKADGSVMVLRKREKGYEVEQFDKTDISRWLVYKSNLDDAYAEFNKWRDGS